MDVAKVLFSTAEKFPDKPAIIFKDQPTTFTQLKDASFRLANSLKELGVKKGDKIAIYLPNWPEYVISYFAIFSLGATAVPLDYQLTIDEMVSCLSHSETKLLIALSKEKMSFEDIKDKVKVVDVATPATFIRYTHNWQGSYQGWYPSGDLLTAKPLSKTLPGLARFYMIGQWVEPGGGLPIVALAGRNVAQMLCKRDGKRFQTTQVHCT